MNQATPSRRDLARRLLALEANESEHPEEKASAALIVFEKLRLHLSKLLGLAGFQALLVRALALAQPEVPWLEAVSVQADATLKGFSEAEQQELAPIIAEGSEELLAQFFGLLVTFIGEVLTLHLVTDVWPKAQINENHLGAKESGHE